MLLDVLILLVCLGDLLHFWATGLSAGVAWSLLQEKSGFDRMTQFLDGAFTFGIFFVLLPAASAALIAALRHLAGKDKSDGPNASAPTAQPATAPSPSPGKPFLVRPSTIKIRSLLYLRISRRLVRPGKGIWLFHLLSALVIAAFTVWMKSAVILEGNAFTPGLAPHPAFFSAWMSVVSTWKIMTPAVFFPVLRKYFVRMFGGEHPHIFHVFSEVFSEDYGLKG